MPRTSPKFGLELRGADDLLRRLSAGGMVARAVHEAAVRAMIENTEDLLGRSQRDAPVDEGTLRASGHAAVYVDGKAVSRSGFEGAPPGPVVEGGRRNAIVGEVGFNTPYALVQHERLDFRHPKGGKAKFLEDNLKDRAGRYQGNLVDHLRGALR